MHAFGNLHKLACADSNIPISSHLTKLNCLIWASDNTAKYVTWTPSGLYLDNILFKSSITVPTNLSKK